MTPRAALDLIRAWLRRDAAPKPATQEIRIIHANGNLCPPGYTLAKDFFTEGDGSHEDAYIAHHIPRAEFSIDFLKPDESVTLHVLWQHPANKVEGKL